MLNRQFLYLTGLPCSGINLIAQLLAKHPDIYSPQLDSPLCDTLLNLRSFLSTNQKLGHLLNVDFDRTYQQMFSGFQGFLKGWYSQISQPTIVDQHPHWLENLELLHLLDSNCKIVACVRELGQICTNIDISHKKTFLLDFAEQPNLNSPVDRLQSLLAPSGHLGRPLKAMEKLKYLEENLQQRVYYVVYEHLSSDPLDVLDGLCNWLGVNSVSIDKNFFTSASSSPQPFTKYVEPSYCLGTPLETHQIPSQLETLLKQNFTWFYQTFYPGMLYKA